MALTALLGVRNKLGHELDELGAVKGIPHLGGFFLQPLKIPEGPNLDREYFHGIEDLHGRAPTRGATTNGPPVDAAVADKRETVLQRLLSE